MCLVKRERGRVLFLSDWHCYRIAKHTTPFHIFTTTGKTPGWWCRWPVWPPLAPTWRARGSRWSGCRGSLRPSSSASARRSHRQGVLRGLGCVTACSSDSRLSLIWMPQPRLKAETPPPTPHHTLTHHQTYFVFLNHLQVEAVWRGAGGGVGAHCSSLHILLLKHHQFITFCVSEPPTGGSSLTRSWRRRGSASCAACCQRTRSRPRARYCR